MYFRLENSTYFWTVFQNEFQMIFVICEMLFCTLTPEKQRLFKLGVKDLEAEYEILRPLLYF